MTDAALDRAYLTGLALQAPPTLPLAEAIELHRLVHRCQYRSAAACGCSGARCGLRSACGPEGSASRTVSLRDCLACVRTYGVA